VSTPQGNQAHSAKAAKAISGSKHHDRGVLGAVWSWINSVATGALATVAGPLAASSKATRVALQQVSANLTEGYKTWLRGVTWLWRGYFAWLQRLIRKYRAQEAAQRTQADNRLYRLIWRLFAILQNMIRARVAAERSAREREVAAAERKAQLELRALHQVIEREAASAYRAAYSARLSMLQRLLDLVVTLNPEVRALAGRIAGGLLDLATIDDPLARVVIGFAIRELIDHLGIDSVIGQLIDDLAGPLLGDPRPAGLHAVIADIAARLAAVEGQWAGFMADGGPQVEQAGEDWKAISSLAGDAAIVAFAGLAVADPAAWATALSDTVGVVLNDAAAAIAALVRKV
jgi:uncharacterized protein YukE